MSKDEEALREYLAEVNHGRARIGYAFAAVLMPGGFALDWITHPDKVLDFLWLRLAASAVALVVLFVVPVSVAKRFPLLYGAAPPLICAIAIEAMILKLEGYSSPYYAGLNLCILAAGVLYNWNWATTTLVCGAIVGVWLVPTLPAVADGTLQFRAFFSNLFFLSLTSGMAVVSTVGRYRLTAKEFGARRELGQTSADLAKTLGELKELDRLKNEFFANVSHELRTPLTLILAPVDELLGNPALAGYHDVLGVVRRNAQRLLRLIEDLLDLGRLDAGGLRLRVGPFDPSALAQAVVDACIPAAAAKSVDLTFETTGPVANLHGDPHRIEIVFTNLIGNALKFTPEKGRIVVRVESDEQGASVVVRDNGPGIAPDDLTRVFERFYQVEGSARRKHGGAGIGLALARDLVELHDGKLAVESEIGKGATFRVWLPAGTDHFRPGAVERRRVVADTEEKRRANDQRDKEAREARTSRPSIVPRRGKDAVTAMLEPAPSSVGASVVLSPAGSTPQTGGETAHEMAQVAELDRLMADWGRRPKIVLAEDEEDLREFIKTVLDRHFEVIAVRDGIEALELLRREQPDLVLSDVMMPGLSGIDLCRAIRQDPVMSSVPVILLTARSGTEATLEAYGVGADDFIQKPFHARVLLARIRAQLKIRALGLKLIAQARLAVAGTLAAGVSHEVRNPLNALKSAISLVREHGTTDDVGGRMLDILSDSSERIQSILVALDEQVRPADGGEVSLVDVQSGIEATLRLLAHRMGNVIVHRRFVSNRRAIGVAAELNQVFLNLLDNAIRTSPHNIWVTVDEFADKVRVSVGDDGPGVAANVATRVFDPFFTTRPVGEGTGLGLYLSRKMVKTCGGELGVRPRTGGGAEFVMEVPGAPS